MSFKIVFHIPAHKAHFHPQQRTRNIPRQG